MLEETARPKSEAMQLRTRREHMPDHGSAKAPDCAGEFWAWAARRVISVGDVGFGFSLVIALLIETGSAFGPAVIIAIAAVPGGSPVQHAPACQSTQPPAAAGAKHAAIMDWLAENTKPSSAQRG